MMFYSPIYFCGAPNYIWKTVKRLNLSNTWCFLLDPEVDYFPFGQDGGVECRDDIHLIRDVQVMISCTDDDRNIGYLWFIPNEVLDLRKLRNGIPERRVLFFYRMWKIYNLKLEIEAIHALYVFNQELDIFGQQISASDGRIPGDNARLILEI